jgi:hypothetical protein
MKTKITLKHQNEILKIDSTDYDEFPEEGDVFEVGDNIFRVAGVESADIVLETIPEEEIDAAHGELEQQHANAVGPKGTSVVEEAAPMNTSAEARARTKKRLAAESRAKVQARRTAKIQTRPARKVPTLKKK